MDKKDFKLVVRKDKLRAPRKKADADGEVQGVLDSPQGELQLFAPVVTAVVNEPPPKKPKTPSAKKDAKPASAAPVPQETRVEGAADQVRHFYQTFFQSGETARPTDKELALASQHLARLGEACARYMVLFAYREAKLTKFAIQNYGGLAQYEGRASAEFAANETQRQEALQKKAREAHQRRFGALHGDYLWDCLTRLEKAPSEPIMRFLKQEKEDADRLAAGKLAQTETGRRAITMFASESARLDRFREFLKKQMEQGQRVEGVLTFWEWDAAHNPEKLK